MNIFIKLLFIIVIQADELLNITEVFDKLFRRDQLELNFGPLYLNKILAQAQEVILILLQKKKFRIHSFRF